MKYVDCKAYAQKILDEVKAAPIKKELRILTMGNDPASASYVKGKIRDCEYCGIPYSHLKVDNEMELDYHIQLGNEDERVGGIIIQLPLPDGVDSNYFVNRVRIDKDVDGFRDNSPFEPCTPEGIMYVLRQELGDLTGMRALVIGRGELVGIPLSARLLAADCTVTIAHSKTKNLDELLMANDIVVSAAGRLNLVDLLWCHGAKIVVDVGVNRNMEGKLCGDCWNFSDYYFPNLKVTPVPGGIGLLTRAMLMKHMVR